MINTVSKINLPKIWWEGGGSTSIWIMSLNILGFLDVTPGDLREAFKKKKIPNKEKSPKGGGGVSSKNQKVQNS